MERNVIFTIAAKNYLASAITLGKSVKRFCRECDFIIYLSDKLSDGIEAESIGFPIYQAEDYDIPDFEQQAFMYDVVEFSTAIKPYFMLYLMNEKKYSKVIYLDPDTWLMDSIDGVFELLDDYEFILTPHIVEESETPNYKETHILDRGVFNLGFLAAKNTANSRKFLFWWQKRLEVYCFRDNRLFVDQKWIAYLPEFCDNFYVLRDKTYNVADWNYHEREIIADNNNYYIVDNGTERKIKFFHFSGIKNQKPEDYFSRFNMDFTEEMRAGLTKLILEYETQLMENGYAKYSVLPYAYGEYQNGEKIMLMHRRIYRKFRNQIKKPFDVTDNSLYAILKKEKLIKEKNGTTVKVTVKKKIYSGTGEQVGQTTKGKVFIFLIKILIRMFGVKKYSQFLKQLQVGMSIDEQTFLVSKYFY